MIRNDQRRSAAEEEGKISQSVAAARSYWERKAGREFTVPQIVEMNKSLVNFFELLHQWDLEKRGIRGPSEINDDLTPMRPRRAVRKRKRVKAKTKDRGN